MKPFTRPDDDGFNPYGSGPVPIGPRKVAP